MERNQRRERIKQQILTKRTTNQKRDTYKSYKRVTCEANAVRCYQLKVQHVNYTKSRHPNYHYKNEEMDIKAVERTEREDPSEETLALTKRWREITQPGDHRFTQGQWKRYNPPRKLKAEQKNNSETLARKKTSCCGK